MLFAPTSLSTLENSQAQNNITLSRKYFLHLLRMVSSDIFIQPNPSHPLIHTALSPLKIQKKRKVDPLIVRYLHKKPENQYSLVVYVFLSVINDQLDTDTLNNLAILCCELTAQCSTLAQEWLGHSLLFAVPTTLPTLTFSPGST